MSGASSIEVRPDAWVHSHVGGRSLPSLQYIAERQERLAAILAMIAGSIDAYGLMTYQTYLSFMSGNTTQTGYALGQGKWGLALPSGLAVAFFICGCFAGTLLAHSALRRARRLVFIIVAATLVSIIGLTLLGILYAGLHIAAIASRWVS